MNLAGWTVLLVLRCAGLLGAVAGLTGLVGRLAAAVLSPVAPVLLSGDPTAVTALPFPQVVVALAALALLGCWLRLAGAVVLHAGVVVRALHRPSPAARRSSATPLVRRTVLAALGLSLPVAVLLPAQADPTSTLAGVPLPDRTTGLVEHRHTVTVRAGDCLWSIARRLLQPGAGVGRVAREVRALGALNAPAIGPDADLIFPGTRLVVPPRDRPGKEQP